MIVEIVKRILSGGQITFEEASELINLNITDQQILKPLFSSANLIRSIFRGERVDLCSVFNAKSGRCQEDCQFCAQSSYYQTGIEEYGLRDYNTILGQAQQNEVEGVHCFSLVTSGRGLTGNDFQKILDIYRRLRKTTDMKLCASHGIISYHQAVALKEAGVNVYHHNLETSQAFYQQICTTHAYEERVQTIKNVLKSGLEICSGGILGLGEKRKDRVQLAFALKELGVKSIPINILQPIPGTPLEMMERLDPWEILKTLAVYRLILPDSYLRYAGGRLALQGLEKQGFRAGVNGVIVGNYLTTLGKQIADDKKMIESLGLVIN